jgi:hypothetical protein
MALHGEIKVNDWEIGNWEAVRQTKHVYSIDEVHTYKCKVFLKQQHVLKRGDVSHEFEVRHRFGDGALVLAEIILRTANELEKAKYEQAGEQPTPS